MDDKLRLSLIAPRLAALLHHQVGLPSFLDMYQKQLAVLHTWTADKCN